MEEFKKLKTRWKRWLGQKTRRDKPYWTTLLDCNWSSWAHNTCEKHSIPTHSIAIYSKLEIKELFTKAINCADLQDLLKLDNLFAEDLIKILGY